jgi:hypothetical protein
MNKFTLFAVAVAAFSPIAAHATDESATVRTEASAPVKVTPGKMLYSGANRLAPVYRVTSEGSPQIVLDGKLVTIPASTLSSVDGKLTTSLSKKDLDKS